jgi:DNA invertase Pin-like site-specific DNA recombinase
LGVTLIAADSPDAFLDQTPTAILIRQVLGAVAQFEKAALVAKLKAARERKKRETGRCEGRKPLAEKTPRPSPWRGPWRARSESRAFRDISRELAAQGHLNGRGKPFNHKSISSMLS